MANDPTTTSAPTESPKSKAPAPVADVALDVWCEEKSRILGKRVESLSAFYRLAQKRGLGRATPEQFDAEFQVFLKTPV